MTILTKFYKYNISLFDITKYTTFVQPRNEVFIEYWAERVVLEVSNDFACTKVIWTNNRA